VTTTISPSANGWTGHLGWRFRGQAQFEGFAAPFLAAGAARHERLVLVSDEPRRELWPGWLLGTGQLVIASTDEIYGPERVVDPETQHRTFEGVLADALADGYAGLTVVADNSSLVEGPERLAAWLEWEAIADRFMAENPVTGLCAFDETRVSTGDLAAAHGCHDQVLTR
jgi:hypothetical protein